MNHIIFDDPLNTSFNIFSDEESKDEIFNKDFKPIEFVQKLDESKINEVTTKATKETSNKGPIINSNEIKEEKKEPDVFLNILNYDLICNKPPPETKKPKKKSSPLKKKRKRTKEHDKYSDDNLRRKSKHITLNSLFNFINEKIEEKYENNIGVGVFMKKLLTINQKQKSDCTIQFNKEFLYKSIGEIFSENISTRYSNYPLTHNKSLIESLINEKDIDKRNYFNNLFNLRFIDVLKHFRGSEEIEELKGLTKFNSIKAEFESDEEYLNLLEYYIMNYENIINNKRSKKERKTQLFP